jgi:hypothetical protein
MLPIKITAHDLDNGSKIELKILGFFFFWLKKMLTYGKQKRLVVCGVCVCGGGGYGWCVCAHELTLQLVPLKVSKEEKK